MQPFEILRNVFNAFLFRSIISRARVYACVRACARPLAYLASRPRDYLLPRGVSRPSRIQLCVEMTARFYLRGGRELALRHHGFWTLIQSRVRYIARSYLISLHYVYFSLSVSRWPYCRSYANLPAGENFGIFITRRSLATLVQLGVIRS